MGDIKGNRWRGFPFLMFSMARSFYLISKILCYMVISFINDSFGLILVLTASMYEK